MESFQDLVPRITPKVFGSGRDVSGLCDAHGPFNGFVFSIAGKDIVPKCPACQAEEDRRALRANAMMLAEGKKLNLRTTFGHAGVPPRFLAKGFSTFEADSADKVAALQAAQNYAVNFSDELHHGRGLIFIGDTGTGKTHLAAAVCKEVIRHGYVALFTSVLECTQVIKESYRKDSNRSEREAILQFVKPDLLVLDEVGMQRGSHTESMLMTELFNQRYAQMKPTILLSNLTVDEIANVLGDRIISRLKEVSDVVVFGWGDYRERARP